MNINALKIIKLISIEGNLTKVSEIEHISTSAISRLIDNIESEYNIKLFSRHGNKMTLTPDGEYFVNQSNNILKIEEDMLFYFKNNSFIKNNLMLTWQKNIPRIKNNTTDQLLISGFFFIVLLIPLQLFLFLY